MFGFFGKKDAPRLKSTEPIQYGVYKNYGVDGFPYSWGMHIQKKYDPRIGFSDVGIIQSYHHDICTALTGVLITGDGVNLVKVAEHSLSDLRIILVYYGHTEEAIVNLIDPITNFTHDGKILPKISETLEVIDPIRINDRSYKCLKITNTGESREINSSELWKIWHSCVS